MREIVDIGRLKEGSNRNYERFYIPLSEHHTKYFDAFLKINEADKQCPDFTARKTSGDCPFYFACGKCRSCKAFKIERDYIIDSWTAALNPYPFGFYEVPSEPSSDLPPDEKKAKSCFLGHFLGKVLRFVTFHNRKCPDENSLLLQKQQERYQEQSSVKRSLPVPDRLKNLFLKVFRVQKYRPEKNEWQIQTKDNPNLLTFVEASLIPLFLFCLASLIGAHLVSLLSYLNQSWDILFSLLIGCSITLFILLHVGFFFYMCKGGRV